MCIRDRKIPTPIKDLLDRKWEHEPNSKESTDGSSELILKRLTDLQKDFKKLISIFVIDIKNGTINNIDPIPIAIVHSAMTIWVEVLKNKYNLKNKKILSKNLLNYLRDVLSTIEDEEISLVSFGSDKSALVQSSDQNQVLVVTPLLL